MKIKTLFFVVLLLFSLCGCAEEAKPMPYEIVEEDGGYYLVLKGAYDQEQILNGHVEFESLAEMKNDLETGKFTEEELCWIDRNYPTDDKGRVLMPDLSALIEVSYPSEFKDQTISWRGKYYSFMLREKENSFVGMCADVDFPSQEEWEEKVDSFKHYYDNPDEHTGIYLEKIAEELERNAKVYYTYGYAADEEKVTRIYHKDVRYTLTLDSKVLYVREFYYRDHYLGTDPDIPYVVSIRGEQQGTYFTVSIRDMDERPSVEWLSEFGVKNYVHTAEDTSEPEIAWWKYGLYIGVPLVCVITAGGVYILLHRRKKQKNSESISTE